MTARGIAVLAVGLVCAVLVTGCLNNSMVNYPFYTTARVTPRHSYDFEGSLTPFEFDHIGNRCNSDFFFGPALRVETGICDHGDIGLETGFEPGIGLFGRHQFMDGKMDAAVGGRASYYWFDHYAAGRYEVSPRVFVSNEKPRTFPFAANVGFSYYGVMYKAGEGQPTMERAFSLAGGFGVPLNLDQPVKLTVQPEFNLNVPLLSNYSYPEKLSGSVGLGLSYRW